jgi:hypothetical protein
MRHSGCWGDGAHHSLGAAEHSVRNSRDRRGVGGDIHGKSVRHRQRLAKMYLETQSLEGK